MRNKVSIFNKNKSGYIRIKKSLLQEDKLDLLFDSVALNAILNGATHPYEAQYHPGACEEIIGIVERWMDRQDGPGPQIIWLSRPVRAGRSAISEALVERGRSRGLYVASFSFSRDDNARNHAQPLVATLIYQLIEFFPALRKQLTECLTAKPLMYKASLDTQFAQLLAAPIQIIQHSSTINRPIILIIDALDECDDEETQQQILSAIHMLSNGHDSPFRVMVSSRAAPHLVVSFNKIGGSVKSIFLDGNYRPESFVRRFVIDEFNKIKRTHRLAHRLQKDWPAEEDINNIVSRSSGQITYVAMIMRFIISSEISPALSLIGIYQLQQPTNHSPFSQFDTIYSHIFSKVRNIRAVNWGLGLYYLSSRIYDTPHYILDIAGYKTNQLQPFFADVSAIAQITIDRGAWKVVFHHASLHDYLKDRSRSGIYHLDEGEFAVGVSELCLQKFYDKDSLDAVTQVLSCVKCDNLTPGLTYWLLTASKRRFDKSFKDLVCWELLVNAINRLYYSSDRELWTCMIQTWIRFGLRHKLDVSGMLVIERKKVARMYKMQVAFVGVQFTLRRRLTR